MEQPEAPSTPPRRHSYSSRDQRREIQTLRSIGWSFTAIANHCDVTERQVQHACANPATPRKRRGRPSATTEDYEQQIEAMVTCDSAGRRLTYKEIAAATDSTVSRVRQTLRRLGYRRCVATKKPPISEANRKARLAWATEHRHWTREQWDNILWSDETWVTAGPHTRVWVTRKTDEVLHHDCVVERYPRRQGWMFWACFSGGLGKGPHLFWEKDWGTIGSESYCARILPLLHGWQRLHPELQVMHDGAPGHAAAMTRDEIYHREMEMIHWPAFSPDLNPIEIIWKWMKEYIQQHFPDKLNYDQLRAAVLEAWESIDPSRLDRLIEKMGDRCQAVMDAKGGYTRY